MFSQSLGREMAAVVAAIMTFVILPGGMAACVPGSGNFTSARVCAFDAKGNYDWNAINAYAIDTNCDLHFYLNINNDKWLSSHQMNSANVSIITNPVAVSMYDPSYKVNRTYVFALDSNGQVYAYINVPANLEYVEKQVSFDLPAGKFRADTQNNTDAVKVISHNSLTYIFVRSLANQSQLFWNIVNSSLIPVFHKWKVIKGRGYLTSDPFAALNTLLGRIEVFAVMEDSHVYHIWQTGKASFSDSWVRLGKHFSPRFNSAPVSHSDSNGLMNLFVRGKDELMYWIHQTNCSKAKSSCTWGRFKKLGGALPSGDNWSSPFSISLNAHFGLEVFVVSPTNGQLYHIWQSEKDRTWSDWESLGGGFVSPPTAANTQYNGWWRAFGFIKYPDLFLRYQPQYSGFSFSSNKIDFGQTMTVSWEIPADEATHKDWLVTYKYPTNQWELDKYYDFVYVGGTQNPLTDPMPKGSVNLTLFLPAALYSCAYMMNGEYKTVLQQFITVSNGTSDKDWVQLYKGIAIGLGEVESDITECVKNGNKSLQIFKELASDIENRKVFKGLHLFAQGLSDVRDALVRCNETVIWKALNKFISDLISCNRGDCAQFLIDKGDERAILYKGRYDIYRSIHVAYNNFNIGAHQQSGYSIGRMTNACLTLT